MKNNILITGGFGYVGGRVAQRLAKLPDTNVILGSRTPQGPPKWLPSASTILTPWSEPQQLHCACEGVDTVLHFAAMNENDAAKDPVGALQINGIGTVNLLNAARAENVKRFIYLSTAHVYGAPLAGDIDEMTCPRPSHPYATSHRAAEDVVLAAKDKGDIEGLVLRLSNSFGAPAHSNVNRWTLLVNDLCRQAVTNKELILHSAGTQKRDFITLADVSRSIENFVGLSEEKLDNGIFNVGGAWSLSVFEMTQLVAQRCEVTLGFLPEIVRPEPLGKERGEHLNYKIGKLVATGFTLENNHEAEIDATLKLCNQAFHAK